MSEGAFDENAFKEKVIKHMNKDHQDSLSRYLEFFCLVPRAAAQTAVLTHVTLDHLIISSSVGRNFIPLDPPMEKWSEIRQRTIALDEMALKGLGRSNITVTTYAAPKGLHAIIFVLCLLTYLIFGRRSNFLPGSLLFQFILWRIPSVADYMYSVQPIFFSSFIALHASEAIWFDRSRLHRHGVKRFSLLWWLWASSALCEGYGAYQRFDRIVRQKQRSKDRANH